MTAQLKVMTDGCRALGPAPQLTIEAGIARGLLKFAVARGASPAALAGRAGLDPADLDDPDRRVPFERYVVLMRAAKALTGDPALALHYAEHVDFSEISVVGLLTLASETMLEAFAQMNRYGRLAVEVEGVGAGDRFEVTRERDGLWVTDRRQNPNAFPELTETTFGRMAWGPRQFGKTPFVLEAQVTHDDPGYGAEYARIFGAPVTFGAARNALRIDPAWSSHRVAAMPRYVFGVLSERADGLLKTLEAAKSTRGRVESLLMPRLHTGEACMDAVARRMGVSRQTLFRRLKAEGVTFEGLLDDLRRRLSEHYLSGRKVSVNETAYLVGFSDPAAFSRAFKRWTGLSPREWRQAV
ncbi:AraC family transcriptional regulator [Phenylobacterium sp.]|uniref:AraC family transcriptional regulator n=1 Tax=Phenylobacterium sp. TaxID=1871053 RepID=UPI0025F5D5F5|nr:AraC family transcriptional regulator [Phenylobacterium sp.]